MTSRIAYFGTGNLAVPSFLSLLDSKHPIFGLVTQPDRVGRGHHQDTLFNTRSDELVPGHGSQS